MSRIQKAYEAILRQKLRLTGARRVDQGLAILLRKAAATAEARRITMAAGLTEVSRNLSRQRNLLNGQSAANPLFICDAGLGGLARWLRAAGYDALWEADISDEALLQVGRSLNGIVLTTDSGILERAIVRDGVIRVFWLPPIMRIPEQLDLVFVEFGLQIRGGRCMQCGGELQPRDKEEIKDRIPPRTYRWLNEFFECQRCGQLFWHGTHWRRIRKQLNQVFNPSGTPAASQL